GFRLNAQERRDRARPNLGQKICRAAWRDDLGEERSQQRINIHLHPTPEANVVMKAAIRAAIRIKSNSLPLRLRGGLPTGQRGMGRRVYTKSHVFRIQKQKGNSVSFGLSAFAHASGSVI